MTSAPTAATAADPPIDEATTGSSTGLTASTLLRKIFSTPPPLKRLFDQFPRRVYAANELPLRSTQLLQGSRSNSVPKNAAHTLFVWAEAGSEDGSVASFNPKCLIWQVYLLTQGIAIRTIPSNNHASPGGILPFFVPNPASPARPTFADSTVVATTSLEKWAKEQDKKVLTSETILRQELYKVALAGPIRRAWLFHMYLTPNFELLTRPAYIHAQTSNSLVRLASAYELQNAAKAELLKHKPKINEEIIYQEAKLAIEAFEGLLRSQDGGLTMGTTRPTLLDAGLFAYTFLLLGLETDKWAHAELPYMFRSCAAVVAHHDLMLAQYLEGGLQVPRGYSKVGT